MQLSVPHRTAPNSHSFDSKAASVKNWIDSLPMANIGETTRLLFEALTDLNHQDIPAQQRFKALELLQGPVHFVTDRMKKHFVGQALPLPARNLKIAHLSREIGHTLATGYKILVMEQIAGVGRKDKKLLVVAIHRALKLLGSVLLKAYQVYEPYPDSVWRELHSLYHHAESNSLHTSKVTDEHAYGRKSSTIADAYKQILLLALACPYRLRHGEAEQVYRALEGWAPFAELQMVGENGSALFATHLDSDQPPSYLVLRSATENRGACRALHTGRLAEQLRKFAKEARESGRQAAVSVSSSTLRHLMLVWGVMPKRRYSRVKDHSEVVVSMGLSSIHYFVSGEVAFNNAPVSEQYCTDLGASCGAPQINRRARFDATTTRAQQGQIPDVWEMKYQIEGRVPPSSMEIAVAKAASGMQIDPKHQTQQWKMVNVSAGGYSLLWDNPETTRAQVGELLGIREQGDPDTFHWCMGIIRWLKYNDDAGLQMGVQMLSPGSVAIAARTDKAPAGTKNFTRGLLLPEIASIQQRATLLLPSPPFKVGDVCVVNCHGKNVKVKLSKLVENTGSFAQFQFIALGEIDTPKVTKPAKKPELRDFDDVWELL